MKALKFANGADVICYHREPVRDNCGNLAFVAAEKSFWSRSNTLLVQTIKVYGDIRNLNPQVLANMFTSAPMAKGTAGVEWINPPVIVASDESCLTIEQEFCVPHHSR